MLAYVATPGCRMAFLRAALDDPALPGATAGSAVSAAAGSAASSDQVTAWRCGRCDRCGGARASAAPEPAAVARADRLLAVPGVELPARRMWPSGMAGLDVPLTGRIDAAERAEAGRAVARLDALGWGGALRDLYAVGPGAPGDGPLPLALRTPVLAVLDAWAPRVDGVVVVASATRPQLVEHLAAGVARHLGVPVVGAVRPRPDRPPGRHDVNSAQRLAGVHRRLELDLSDGARAGLAGRSVLLVDDRYDSGWTVTVAARLLLLAGAGAVLPLTLALG